MKAKAAKKAMKSTGKLTASGAYSAVAEKVGLKNRQVKEVAEAVVALAAVQLKKTPAQPARKGVNPFTKEPCVFKAKPASQTVRALPMKKLKKKPAQPARKGVN